MALHILKTHRRSEKENQKKFKLLFEKYPDYYIPFVVEELTTKHVMTTEFVKGTNIDKLCEKFDQVVRLLMVVENSQALCRPKIGLPIR